MIQFFNELTGWVKDTSRYYNTILELSRLSDKELSDLGLSRFEIAHIAGKQYFNRRIGE